MVFYQLTLQNLYNFFVIKQNLIKFSYIVLHMRDFFVTIQKGEVNNKVALFVGGSENICYQNILLF
jgi:hypothetical protein